MIKTCYACGKRFNDKFSKEIIIEHTDGSKRTVNSLTVDGVGPFYFCNQCILPYMKGACDTAHYEYRRITLIERLPAEKKT